MWRSQCELLSGHGYAPIAIDLPGHGSRSGETFTLASARAALDEAVDGDPRAAVVGLSLGGYVSMNWASRTATPPSAHRAFLEFSRLVGRAPRLGELLSDRAARAVVGEQAAQDVARGGVSVAGQVQALQAMRDATPLADLVNITRSGIPVTFITGGFDHFRLDERAFLAAAGDPPVLRIPTANHLVSLHRPHEYGEALVTVLDQLS